MTSFRDCAGAFAICYGALFVGIAYLAVCGWLLE